MSECIQCQVLKQKLHEAMCALKVVSAAVDSIDRLEPVFKKSVTGPFDSREELREAVHELFDQGMTGTAIARTFGVSITTVSRIKNGDKSQSDDGLPVHAASEWKNRVA